jgi:lauroyl/myristoyl acyltransferase
MDTRLFSINGLEHLEGARAGELGPIVVSSHLNSNSAFIALERLRARGYDVRLSLPSKREPYPLSKFRRWLYRFTGGRTFVERMGSFYAQFNIRPIVRCLTAGTGVLVVGDGWHSASFVKTEFLGHPVHFTTGPMSIARLTGAPAVPLFTLGHPPDKLRFVFEEPILADPAVSAQDDIERMVLEYVRRLEEHVRANIPSWQHWFEPEALDTMEHWPQRSLDDRYRIG